MLKRNPNFAFFILRFSVCISLYILISCNKHNQNKNIFHYNYTSGIATLDPAFAKSQAVMWAVHQLYNTLVEIDDQTNIIPSLAKSWDISVDNLTYTFHLRTDVFFHDRKILF
jgi:peptide/nickel transport system substrate-binding protein